jgi:hypothetical protein
MEVNSTKKRGRPGQEFAAATVVATLVAAAFLVLVVVYLFTLRSTHATLSSRTAIHAPGGKGL